MSDAKIPENLAYTEDHEWLSQDSDISTIGITDYAQSELGDIVFVELPEVGSHIQQGEPFGTIEAVKTVEDLIAPVSGEVLEINDGLEESAELVNQDPYGAGWMLKIRLEEPAELEQLIGPAEYAELISGGE
jgi:glycine cleavage system H protein